MIIEVRAMVHFFYLLDMPDEYVLVWLGRACAEGIVNLQTVQLWTSKFRNGETDLDDELRPG
jgi:hypothetical protein